MTVTDTDLCPGTGRFPKTVKRGRGYEVPTGTCTECEMAVELLAHPDGGPEGVVGEHPRPLGEENARG